MRLRVMLHRGPGRGARLQVTADGTATVGDVANALAAGDPQRQQHAAAPDFTLTVTNPSERKPVTLNAHTSLLDSGVQSGSTIELVSRHKAPRPSGGGSFAARLTVLSGVEADRGSQVDLRVGSSRLGRSDGNDVRLNDPKVSANHARINVGQIIEVIDTNSSNGVLIGGVKVSRAVVGRGDVVTVGGTEFTVEHTRTVTEVPVTSTDISFTRSPRVLERPVAKRVTLPDAPSEPGRTRFPVLAMIAPLVMGSVLFAVTRSSLSIVFVCLSPLLMVGNYIDQRVQTKRKYRADTEAFMAALSEARTELLNAQNREREQLERLYPSVAACLTAAQTRDDLFWSRRAEHPEFLAVRLGTGTITPQVTPELGQRGQPHYTALAQETCSEFGELSNAAIVADLRSVGGVGVCGNRELLDGVARALVLQLAVLHSPAELALACLTSSVGAARWGWLEWLPHTFSAHSPLGAAAHLSALHGTGRVLVDLLDDLIEVRSGERSATALRGPVDGRERLGVPAVPSLVIVVDEATVDPARLTRIAERGPDVGIHVLWVAGARASIPAACRTYLDIGSSGTDVSAGMVRHGRTYEHVHCESLSETMAVDIARAMAPVVDNGVPIADDSDLPRSVPVVSLLGHAASDDAEFVLNRWRENQSLVDRSAETPVKRDRPGDLRALVGHTGVEPFTLDLRSQGPHALVGGTTGAGKSEFLQAWVLGMAHANSPDRVTFLFVDYKGGAAFAAFKSLPHAVGTVTDLSPYLVQRALKSLKAELRQREQLLNRKGKKDLIELELTGDPECPPSLIIVVDEFAALKSEVPEFVQGVVDVAQRGRSLGLHLILATQRPGGVITDDIRANTNLRIALRVADEQDSVDVLGTPMAARLDPDVPGRGVAKTGPGRLVPFQSAFPGSRTPAEPPAPPIEVLELEFGSGRPWKMPERRVVGDGVAKDIERVVTTIENAATLGRIPSPRRPWLDTLAQTYDLLRLNQGRDTEIVIGVIDDPDHQRQVREFFRPDADGNILYIGTANSGKSTALRTLACASAMTAREGLTHVYGLEFSGGALSAVEVLPNVGSIILGDDEERVGRLMRYLIEIIEERTQRFRAVMAESLPRYREAAKRPKEPRVLLLLDGFGTFKNDYENTPSYALFQRILLDGRSVGVHVAMTADRPASVPTSIGSSFLRRVVLKQADEDGYVQMGLPRDVLTRASGPGRAMQAGRPLELQLGILGQDVSAAGQLRLVEQLAADLADPHPDRPPKIAALAKQISVSKVPATVRDQPVLGVEDLSLQPIAFDATGVLLVAGPPQSGRTSALRWLAESLGRAHPQVPRVHFAPRASSLSGLPTWQFSRSDVEGITGVLDVVMPYANRPAVGGVPNIAIFVEGLPELGASFIETRLAELVKICRRNGNLLIAEGESSAWRTYSQLAAEVKNGRTGLLLHPHPDDKEIVDPSLPPFRRSYLPPGRGYLIKGGKVSKVQLPLVGT